MKQKFKNCHSEGYKVLNLIMDIFAIVFIPIYFGNAIYLLYISFDEVYNFLVPLYIIIICAIEIFLLFELVALFFDMIIVREDEIILSVFPKIIHKKIQFENISKIECLGKNEKLQFFKYEQNSTIYRFNLIDKSFLFAIDDNCENEFKKTMEKFGIRMI